MVRESSRKYTSPENQNELLELISHSVLQELLDEMRSSPFLAVMMDETTDILNQEQLAVVIRWGNADVDVAAEAYAAA